MKRLILTLIASASCLFVAAQEKADSLAFANAPWEITDLGKGAEARYASIPMFGSVQSISVISYPAKAFKTSIVEGEGIAMGETVVKRGHANHAAHTSSLAEAAKAKMAINASYFNMRKFTPVTYTRIGRKVYGMTTQSETFRTNGVVMMKCHDVDIITCTDTTKYGSATKGWKYAIASGPVLMENGEIVTYSPESIKGSESFYDKRHPRTIIGVSKNAKGRAEKVFFIVIDGRFPAQADGATIKECADIAYFLGCDEALNLDGGGSSTIWSTLTGVINHPYDNRVFDHEGERRVPNIIIAK